MCKHHYDNENFPLFANGICFIVDIMKISLGRLIVDSNTKMGVAHAFQTNLQISYENPMFRRQLQVVVFPHLGIPGMDIMASCKAVVVGYIAPSTLSLTFFISSCTLKSKKNPYIFQLYLKTCLQILNVMQSSNSNYTMEGVPFFKKHFLVVWCIHTTVKSQAGARLGQQ